MSKDTTNNPTKPTLKNCSFCSAKKDTVEDLISGPGVYICNNCIDLCNDIIKENNAQNDEKIIWKYTPKALNKFLDEFVIGQNKTKKIISVAVYNHYKRLKNIENSSTVEIDKSNVLMLGPTGSGKTLIAKTIARILNVPFIIADATTLTEAGYVGDDVENVIKSLLSKCDFDAKKAEKGIIFLDEIDKISRRSDSVSITRDVSGEGVQQAMLKLIEGTIASITADKRKHPDKPTIEVDTSKILFICGGAFDGLEKIVQKRISKKSSIGFGANVENNAKKQDISKLLNQVEPDDLIKYGLIPELVGRLPICVSLQELDEKALIKILTKPKNAIVKQFIEYFKMDGVKLTIQKPALIAIAKLAIKQKIGARGLRSILENILLDTMYQIPSIKNVAEVVINEDVVNGKQTPEIIKI